MPLRSFLLRENGLVTDCAFHFIPFETDVLNRAQDLDPVYLPIKLFGLGVDGGKKPPGGRRSHEWIRHPLYLGRRFGKESKVTPYFKNNFSQSFHLHIWPRGNFQGV